MKKLNYVIISIFLFLISLSNVNALVKEKTRYENQNYGVKKGYDVNYQIEDKVKATPYVDANEKIYDYAECLSEEETIFLKDIIESFIDKTNMDFAILIDDKLHSYDYQYDEHANNFYNYNDFGLTHENYSGILIYVNRALRRQTYKIYAYGNAKLYFSLARYQSILGSINDSINQESSYSTLVYLVEVINNYFNLDPIIDVNFKTRTKDNNYGVNKKWHLNDHNVNKAVSTYYVETNRKIYDFAGILSKDEITRLESAIDVFVKRFKTELIILTDARPYRYDGDNEDFAVDFYDYNDFGIDFLKYDGIVLYRNAYVDDPYYDMYTFGDAQLYFDQNRYDDILDGIYYNLSNQNYLSGFTQFINYINQYYEAGIPYSMKYKYVDDMGYLQDKYRPPIFLALVISSIVTLITIHIMKKKNIIVKQETDADIYLDLSTINFTLRKNQFTHSNTRTIKIESSSGGGGSSHGGGGGHSSSGSSGGGHSSGGGRHG